MKPDPVLLPEFIDPLRAVLARHPQVNFAMLFGSLARGTARPDSDLDLAVGADRPLHADEIIALISDLAIGHRPPGGPDRPGRCRRAAAGANPRPWRARAGRQHPARRAAQPPPDRCRRLRAAAAAHLRRAEAAMDRTLIAQKIESLRLCTRRIHDKCPPLAEDLARDIDAQDIIAVNLTRAVQPCVDIASHWIAASGLPAPQTMGEAFARLADAGVLDAGRARRRACATPARCGRLPQRGRAQLPCHRLADRAHDRA